MKLNCLKQINLAVKLNNPVCFICTIDVEIKNNMSPRGSTDRETGAIIAAGWGYIQQPQSDLQKMVQPQVPLALLHHAKKSMLLWYDRYFSPTSSRPKCKMQIDLTMLCWNVTKSQDGIMFKMISSTYLLAIKVLIFSLDMAR